MSSHASFATHEHRLSLAEILDVLVADGLVARADADALLLAQRRRAGEAHPLVLIAGQKWHALQQPHRLLGIEELTEWLAGKGGYVGQGRLCVEVHAPGRPYLYVDPSGGDYARYAARLG